MPAASRNEQSSVPTKIEPHGSARPCGTRQNGQARAASAAKPCLNAFWLPGGPICRACPIGYSVAIEPLFACELAVRIEGRFASSAHGSPAGSSISVMSGDFFGCFDLPDLLVRFRRCRLDGFRTFFDCLLFLRFLLTAISHLRFHLILKKRASPDHAQLAASTRRVPC